MMKQPERRTAHVHALVTPQMRADFEWWCEARGLTVSAAVSELIRAVLHRDPRTARKRAYRPVLGDVSGQSQPSPAAAAPE